MSTLTIRAIEDDYYFASFNPNGETWCSLNPNFQMASTVYCEKNPKGQNTIFLTDNDEKIWNNQITNPPLFFTITISGISNTIYIPTLPQNPPYNPQTLVLEINTLLLAIPIFNVFFTYNKVFQITNNLGVDITINFSPILSASLGFAETTIVPLLSVLSGKLSTFELYYPPKKVNAIKIVSDKLYKGQYYLALEDCNIRVKNNFDKINITQPLAMYNFVRLNNNETLTTISNDILTIPANRYKPEKLAFVINQMMKKLNNEYSKVYLSYSLGVFEFSNSSNKELPLNFSDGLSKVLGLQNTITIPAVRNIPSIEIGYKFSGNSNIKVKILEEKKVLNIPTGKYTKKSLVNFLNHEFLHIGEKYNKISFSLENNRLCIKNDNKELATLIWNDDVARFMNITNIVNIQSNSIVKGNVPNGKLIISTNKLYEWNINGCLMDSSSKFKDLNLDIQFNDETETYTIINHNPYSVKIDAKDIGLNNYILEKMILGKISGQKIKLVNDFDQTRPLVFEDTCIFVQVEILQPAEQGDLEFQNFNQGVIINYDYTPFGGKVESTNNKNPFATRKILFPIMMRRDIPPWNGTKLELCPTNIPDFNCYPNAKITGFSSENRSKVVHLIPLNPNEHFKISFWRSNGDKLPMATDLNYLNPNVCFESEEEAEEYYSSLDNGWFISQASVLLRVSNARPEYL